MIKITERGWPGHFILGHKCMYHRNTLIESANDRVIVSTVGALFLDNRKKMEEIGVNRFYETMVFGAHQVGEYIEANVRDERGFDSPWAIGKEEVETYSGRIDLLADDMHETVVKEFIHKLKAAERG